MACYHFQRQVIRIDRISLKTLKLLCRKFSDLFPPTLTRAQRKRNFSPFPFILILRAPLCLSDVRTESKMQSQALHKGTHTAHI